MNAISIFTQTKPLGDKAIAQSANMRVYFGVNQDKKPVIYKSADNKNSQKEEKTEETDGTLKKTDASLKKKALDKAKARIKAAKKGSVSPGKRPLFATYNIGAGLTALGIGNMLIGFPGFGALTTLVGGTTMATGYILERKRAEDPKISLIALRSEK